jgi:hypothetical protein
VRYAISFGSDFEVGLGDFNGGSPGELTRSTVLASSNGGALVNWGAGTKDVFAVLDLDRPVVSISGGYTAALADLGNLILFSGTSNATLALPAVAGVPPGSGFLVRHGGGKLNSVLTIDPNGSETINGATVFPLCPGEGVEVLRVGSGWQVFGAQTGMVLISRYTFASDVLGTFALPSGFGTFHLLLEGVRPATDAADLVLRTSTDGGSTVASGSGAYQYGQRIPASTTTDLIKHSENATFALLHVNAASASGDGASGVAWIHNARTAGSKTIINAQTGYYRSGIQGGPQAHSTVRAVSEDNNAIQLSFSAGNLADGTVELLGRRTAV